MPRGTWSEPGIQPSFWRLAHVADVEELDAAARQLRLELLDGDVLDALLGLGDQLADRFLWREHGESSASGIPSRSRPIKGARSGRLAHQRELHPVEEPAVESHPAGEEQDEQAGAVGGMEPAEHFQRRGGEEARDGQPRQARAVRSSRRPRASATV